MGSKDKFFSVTSADKGTDDVGIAQSSGTVSAAADAKTASGRWSGKTLLTVNSTAGLSAGMPINLTNLDAWLNYKTTILAVVSSTQLIVAVPFQTATDVTGNWDITAGGGAWDALMPMGADLPAANLALTFWDPSREGGNEIPTTLLQGKMYMFPGVIKTIAITTAGNVKLFRAATRRPFGKDGGTAGLY